MALQTLPNTQSLTLNFPFQMPSPNGVEALKGILLFRQNAVCSNLETT